MGDEKDGASAQTGAQIVTNTPFGVVVQGAGGLVHHQKLGIAQQRSGDGQALALAATQS